MPRLETHYHLDDAGVDSVQLDSSIANEAEDDTPASIAARRMLLLGKLILPPAPEISSYSAPSNEL